MNSLAKTGFAIVVFVGVFALAWFVYYPHSPLGKQEANLRLAEQHQPKIQESLRRIKGADKVSVGVHTGLGGSLIISGDVADEQAAEAVISGVVASSPPVTVQFLLDVGETNGIRKVIEFH